MVNRCIIPLTAVALTCAVLWPIFTPYDGMPAEDGAVMAWNQWHNAESVLDGANPLYTDLWAWPNGMSLAKHTLSSGFAPVAILVRACTDSPLWPFYALRIIIFGSFAVLWLLTYYLLGMCGATRTASGIVASCFAFSNFFAFHAQYPHFAAMFFYPLCTILLLRFRQVPSFGRLVTLACTVAVSVYFTEMVLFWCIGVALGLLFYAATERGRVDLGGVIAGTRVVWWPVALAAAVAVAAPFLWAFARVDSLTPAGTAAGLSASIPDMPTWMGWLILLAAVLFMRKRTWWPMAAMAGLLLLFAMGPDLHVNGVAYAGILPYGGLSHIPPFDAFRAPYRLCAVALFFLTIPAALGISLIRNRAILGLVVAWAAFECLTPHAYTADRLRREFAVPSPAFIETIQSQPEGVWATYPPVFYDTAGVYAQVFHHQPLFAGCWASRWASGADADYTEYLERSQSGDTHAVADWLASRGVRNVLLVRGEFPGTADINVVDVRDIDLNPFTEVP